jgi:hypothetical protein
MKEGYYTGIALANPRAQNSTIILDLAGIDTQRVSTQTIPIPAGHAIAKLLTEIFPGLFGKSASGSLKL